MKRWLTTMTLTLGLLLSTMPAFADPKETSGLIDQQHTEIRPNATRACPDCSGTAHTITGVTFENGMNCNCTGSVSLTVGSGTTVKNGATVTFTAPVVSVKSGARFENGASVSIVSGTGPTPTPNTTITAIASPSSIPADGATYSLITATLKDNNGQPLPQGTSVTFTTNLGSFGNGAQSQTESTNSSGQAAVALRGTTAGTATVTATSNGASAQATVTIATSATGPGTLSLSVSKTSVKSDNSDNSTITATVLDANNAGVAGIEVTFSANGGQISATSATTDVNGQAGITFSSGTTDPTNQTVTITASGSGLSSKTIPIQIVGSTVALSTDKTTITADGSTTASLTITAKNAGGTGIYNTMITLSVTGTGSATVTPDSGTSDVNGQLTVTVTGSSAGSVTVTASALGATAAQDYTVSAVGTEFAILLPETDPFAATVRNTGTLATRGNNTTIAFVNSNPDTITRSDGGSFLADGFVVDDVIMVGGSTSNDGKYTLAGVAAATLTLAATDSLTAEAAGASVTLTNGVLVRVRAFTQANVIFSTSMGVWDGGTSAVITKAPVSGYVWSVLTAGDAGSATVQVSDQDNTATSDKTTVAFSASSADAARITLQASTYVVARSTTTTKNTATLTALVRSAAGQVVGGAPVVFSIQNSTGGGETVSPVLAFTDSSGVATATFTSGSLSTGAEGVEITAQVLDEGQTDANNTIAFVDTNPDTITRSDGGSFVADGFEGGEQIRVVGSTINDGYYFLSSVTAGTLTLNNQETLNAEGTGADVTLTAVTNSINIVIGGQAGSVVIGRGSEPVEVNDATYKLTMSVLVADANGNPVPGAVVSLSAWPAQYSSGLWYDRNYSGIVPYYDTYVTRTYTNEDINENTILDPGEDTNGDGELTPRNSAAGNVPTTVTTDASGVATFDLVYLKNSAKWIYDRIRASTEVLGTEITSSLNFTLPVVVSEGESGTLPDSPYPVYLVTDTINPVQCTFPQLGVNTVVNPDSFSTTSPLTAGSSSVSNGAGDAHDYEYDPTGGTTPASVGDVVWDWIDGNGHSTTFVSELRVRFPVRIAIQ